MIFKIFTGLLVFLFLSSCKEQQQSKEVSLNVPTGEEKRFASFLDSLKQTKATDYQIINEIRKYLAPKVDRGEPRDTLAQLYYKIPWEKFSGFHCVELFEQNKLTGECGLTSYILAKLYDYAGYKNYIYDCGYDTLGLSHEFNLVQLDGELIVQDAFADMTINNNDETPKDFVELLSEIKRADFSNIKVMQDSTTSECWTDSLDKLLTLYCSNEKYKIYLHDICISDNKVKAIIDVNYGFFSWSMMQNMQPLLKSAGLGENFLSIYLKPMFLKNGNTGAPADSLMRIVKSVIDSGLPN